MHNQYKLVWPKNMVKIQLRYFGISREAAAEQIKGLEETVCPVNFEKQGLLSISVNICTYVSHIGNWL